ncbi:MAG: hypothetical protein COY66_05375 [Candidatus Kerfeldbacteria bacterium CG_4_10_14_0_8_um_filter_42_10]|uniref:Aminoglycoside phosphotransferase domain-containing protein n=1 Tax=Candidatus Kerfeldbacteria bacterium CG_4_10_14_0_8_um_filter_42_10 TaxID=2014248 RepID=A0A2M7RGR3_9BACT|nr:MAG: hypothetical protein COY66_05375 [Candidatus Kerfeldbacteria bacterium CG_4_10_14_0_8_um_filter_42_10]
MNKEVINVISKVKQIFKITEKFTKATTGTNSQVFVSKNFVIKMNQDIAVIKNEYAVIKSLKLKYFPETMDFTNLSGYGIILEKRIKGSDVQKAWRRLKLKNKAKIINDLATAVSSFHRQKHPYFWSLKSNKKFRSYDKLLINKFKEYKKRIFDNETAYDLFLKVEGNLDGDKMAKVFKNVKPVLVHGDLIMHNILADKKNLTGIIDWEYTQFGDPFYDLARVIYYQECAKAYVDEKRDVHFEYDFTSRLINKLRQSIKFNEEKYKIIRSVYFIDTIIWALNSTAPEKNLKKLKPPTLKQLIGENY